MITKLFKSKTVKRAKSHRGEAVMKEGATKSTIRENVSECRQCYGKNDACSLCKGTGWVACELIVNIFPSSEE